MRGQYTIGIILVFVVLLLSTPSTVFAAAKKARSISEEENKFTARSASRELKEVTRLQEKIVALPVELRNLAIMSAGGLLSTKFSDWGQHEIAEGKKTRAQLQYIMGAALLRLSTLTQAAKLFEAAACHFSEAELMFKLSKGEDIKPANCRQAAYPTELQASALAEAYRPEVKVVEKLVNDWATSALMLGSDIAKLDKYGEQ